MIKNNDDFKNWDFDVLKWQLLLKTQKSSSTIYPLASVSLHIFLFLLLGSNLITAANFCLNGKFAVVGTYDGRCIFYETEVRWVWLFLYTANTVCFHRSKGLKILCPPRSTVDMWARLAWNSHAHGSLMLKSLVASGSSVLSWSLAWGHCVSFSHKIRQDNLYWNTINSSAIKIHFT